MSWVLTRMNLAIGLFDKPAIHIYMAVQIKLLLEKSFKKEKYAYPISLLPNLHTPSCL